MTANFLMPTTAEFLRLQAIRRGSLGGLRFADTHVTFAELAEASSSLAAWLARRGVGAGDAVGVMAANHPAMVASMFAVWSLGAVALPIGVRSSKEEATHLLTHGRCVVVLSDPPRAEVARAAAHVADVAAFTLGPTIPLRPKILRRGRLAARRGPRTPRPGDLAVLAYTSGTTGAPKGVMLSHGNLMWSALACATARGDCAESVGICLSPLTHTPVFVSHLLCRLLHGSTAVLVEKFETAAVIEAVERYAISDLPLIAGMVFDIVSLGSIPDAVRRSVRKVSVGGAATPMKAKRDLGSLFDGAEIIEAYGQSESTDGVTMARGRSVFDREGTIGRMNPHVVVAVRRADGTLADADESGELVIAGPTVMQGYYRDRPATAAAIRDGWLHTGDLGRHDPDGYFYITGRAKNLIISGGENIAPAEIEDVLRTHPQVADVAVIGTPHAKWGEQVTAIVVRRPGAPLDAEELIALAGRHLAHFKKPRRIEFVTSLPRNAANKVLTNLLKQQFS